MNKVARALIALSALPLVASSATATSVGDAGRGAVVFRACAACHSTTARQHMTGPSLAHVWNRQAGTVQGFDRYSDAMKRSDVVWTAATLDKWLTNPDAFIPGTAMTFPGLRDAKARSDVIAYLEAVSEGRAPTPRDGMSSSGMMNMGGQRPDLKAAPPVGQVTAIKHCRDTYIVGTADGKVNKVWEFNLRFKTDASRLGPKPGKPVIIGGGMQGDRASIVFATPSEISGYISESCDQARP